MAIRSSPFFWFLLCAVALESAASFLLPYRAQPQASQADRNPTLIRAWPEYLSGPGPSAGRKRIALVGNSQAVAWEITDTERLYVARLKQTFAADHVAVDIENWSVQGLSTDQIELLSMQAVRRGFDLLVLVLGPDNIDLRTHYRLGSRPADLDLLAGKPSLWRLLPGAAFYPQTRYDDILRRALLINSDLARSRIAVLDLLAQHVEPGLHRFVFGSRRPRDALFRIEQLRQASRRRRLPSAAAPQNPAAPRPYTGASAEQWRTQFLHSRLPTFAAFYPAFRERLSRHHVGLLWIWMPLVRGEHSAVIKNGAKPFFDAVCREVATGGAPCVDMSDALPAEAFLSLGFSSHLNETGHELMARKLYPLLRDALH